MLTILLIFIFYYIFSLYINTHASATTSNKSPDAHIRCAHTHNQTTDRAVFNKQPGHITPIIRHSHRFPALLHIRYKYQVIILSLSAAACRRWRRFQPGCWLPLNWPACPPACHRPPAAAAAASRFAAQIAVGSAWPEPVIGWVRSWPAACLRVACRRLGRVSCGVRVARRQPARRPPPPSPPRQPPIILFNIYLVSPPPSPAANAPAPPDRVGRWPVRHRIASLPASPR